MTYCVIDTEITTRNRGDDTVGDMQASPYHPSNEIVVAGYKTNSSGFTWVDGCDCAEYVPLIGLLVVQNASFDVQWLLRQDSDWVLAWIRDGGVIWDTQIAEYILTGQEHTYASLNELAAKYGGTQKHDRIKEYWDAGIDTSDIPKEELLEYLKHDVLNTELVFKAQMDEAERLGMLSLMRNAMEDRLATILMEWNGMRFDTAIAKRNADALRLNLADIENKLEHLVADIDPLTHWVFNPSSPQHVSKILFGGTNAYQERAPILNDDGTEYKFKTGNRAGEVKTKLVDKIEAIKGFGIAPDSTWAMATKGIFSTSEDNLTELLSREPAIPEQAAEFIKLLLEYKGISKDISTYYEGYTKLTWPTDGCLHGSINHCLTITGRLSCSAPNLTNVSRDDE